MDGHQASNTPHQKPKTSSKIYIIGALAVIFIIGAALFFFKPSPPTLSLWRQIKPGVTSKEEVVQKLGNPTEITPKENGEFLTYPSENNFLPNEVFINSQTNKAELVIKHVEEKEKLKFSAITKIYGQPEKEMYNRYGAFSRTYIWASKGIAMIGNKETGQVFEVAYFNPTTLKDYIEKYGQGLSEENPYAF